MQNRFLGPSFLVATIALASFLLVASLVHGPFGGEAGIPPPTALLPHVEGELLIKFRPEVKDMDRLDTKLQLAATSRHRFESGAEH